MPVTRYLVFNRPPIGISDEEFNAWAIPHFAEILAAPGWVSAQRLPLEPAVVPETPIPFSFLSLYELEGDPVAAVNAMKEESKGMVLPEWFDRAQEEKCFASWTCHPLSELITSK